ncbi:MAG: rhodanese-like domain-containing protein [Alcaligenaceae bacterium]|nr:rhodanese-like domain-containing protein [Alcaligenaceae bacterium]
MDFLIYNNTYLFVIAALLSGGMLAYQYSRNSKGISPAKVVQMTNSKTAVIIDIRPSEQYQAGTIANAMNIPFEQLKSRAATLPKGKAVVVVDQDDRRASSAAAQLKKEGVEEVHYLNGGAVAWLKESLPLKNPSRSKKSK